ncbi:helix-turn-helix transcriptional regulator [Litoreibacter janthinus]|uniref:LuxR family transcriptional regulator n=1 Tax=Litoreibacter janthinus TaxID=670154 RepID=A0A1I6H987_9RHOB|nr:autoinducer binding domain-containing protein [Litoreibacter janthinus]SFR50938.1 LuxR family transcriptional regulator [Litoreibacter janthinus]
MSSGFSDALLRDIKNLAPSGFRVVRNASITDAVSDFVEGMPEAWVKVYVKGGYAMGDPVFLWSVLNSGSKRWSEIRINDFHGVLEKSKEYGLNFGVVTSRLENGRFSILSVARADREYTDAEIDLCKGLLDKAVLEGGTIALLKPTERDVLWALSQGETLKDFAEQTGVPISTIKDRLRRARIALGAKTAAQAVAEAIRKKLL